MSKRVLVTGGAGFIGGHVVRALDEAGHKVVVFDQEWWEDLSVNVTAVQANLFDSRKLIAAASDCDTAIHLAAHANVRWCEDHAGEACRLNIGGCRQLTFALMHASVNRIIYANSCAARDPISVYGYTKRAGLLELRDGAAEYEAEVISLRLANVYGPCEHNAGRVVPSLIECAREGRAPTLSFNGELERDFVHVHDVAQAFVKAVEDKRRGVWMDCELGIGTGVRTSLQTLYGLIGSHFKRDQLLCYSGDATTFEPRSAWEDPWPAKNLLNWKPTITLQEGLRALCQEKALT